MHRSSCLTIDDTKAVAKLRQRLTGKAIVGYWTVEDVQSFRPDLTSAQSFEVLEAAQENFDASLGINWTVLVGFAQALYPLAEDEHEAIATHYCQAVRWAEDWIQGRFSRTRERQRTVPPG